MRTSEEIIEECKELEIMPSNYELLEQHLFLVIRQILTMYQNNIISSEKALVLKKQAVKEYNLKKKVFEFKVSMFREHIEKIGKTQMLRIELRKLLNSPDIDDKEILNRDILNTCMQLIELYSGEEFT